MLLLLLACTSPPTAPETTTVSGDSGDATTELGDTAIESVPGAEDDGCGPLYRQGLLADFRLDLDPPELAALEADYAAGVKAWHPATFTWVTPSGEAQVVEDAAVRLRGNPGFSWIGDKMQFLIGFDVWDGAGRFQGQRRLALDASWYNPSLLRDRLAYSFLRRAGVPAPCANHATVAVNGEYYGVYTNVEPMDQELLERVYGKEDATGGLWEAGYDLDANKDTADLAAIQAFWADPSVANQEAVSDLEANIMEWAGEAVVPQADGYWCCSHNFYLYEHPTDGITFLPWDLDYSFDSAPWFASPDLYYRDSNHQPHIDAVRADPTWGPRFLEALATATAAYEPELMTEQIDTWSAQIEAAMVADPHTSISPDAHRDGVDRLRAFVEARRGFLDGWVPCAQGDDTDHDGDGATACSDCDDGDPAIHPGAVEVCNRRDDDCDLWTDEEAGCDTCDEVAFGDSRFLVCSEPLTAAQASAQCTAQGGALAGSPRTTEEWYLLVYETYWQDEAWAGVTDWWVTEECSALRPASWTTTSRDCETRLPSICRL